jgi:hypothetical protein
MEKKAEIRSLAEPPPEGFVASAMTKLSPDTARQGR